MREAWYQKLEPYVHYIPVKHDLSDLEEQLLWALANSSRLHTIARNGASLALRWLSRRAQVCPWSSLLRELAKKTDGPILLDREAKRMHQDEIGRTVPYFGAVLHDPLATAPATLRPQLLPRGHPTLLDIQVLFDLHIGYCNELTRSHLCLDV